MSGAGPPREAMVLSGGGAHGAYEVGVMIALFQGDSPATGCRPLEVNQFAATSVGAVNAAAMVAAAGLGDGLARAARRLRQTWLEQIARPPGGCENGVFRIRGSALTSLRCLLRPEVFPEALRDGGALLRGLPSAVGRFARVATPVTPDTLTRAILEQINVTAVIDRSPLLGLLRRNVPLDALSKSRLMLKVVAANLDTGHASIFTGEDMADRVGHDAILASAAIPGFFAPVVVDGAVHVDGGALMNTPVIPAAHGSDALHVVYLDPSIESIRIGDLRNTLGVVDRMLTMAFASAVNRDIALIDDFNRTFELLGALGSTRGDVTSAPGLGRAAAALAVRLRGSTDFTPTTIHRYHPTDDLGGALGFLDFTLDRVNFLINRGYRDAVEHDCDALGCVLPGRKGGG